MNGRRCSGSSRVLPRGPPEKDISAYGHKYGHAEYKRAHTGSGDGVHRPAHGRVSAELGKLRDAGVLLFHKNTFTMLAPK